MKSIQQLKQSLADGVYDQMLSHLYCRPISQLQPYRERIIRVTEGYQATFGKDDTARVSIFSAPGRTEIGGNHTDHQQGKVLAGSVDLDALACAAPNDTTTVRIC